MQSDLFFTALIPAHNEEGNLYFCVKKLVKGLSFIENLRYEVLIVNDCSSDSTSQEIDRLKQEYGDLIKYISRTENNGFGNAVRSGLKKINSKYFSLVMADSSDSPVDLVKMILLAEKFDLDAVFTHRFNKLGYTEGYPDVKYIVNRIGNNLISLLYGTRFNDLTNAFQLVKFDNIREVELKSKGFALTIELSLTVLKNGKDFKQIPVSWYGRDQGVSKMNLFSVIIDYLGVVLKFLIKK